MNKSLSYFTLLALIFLEVYCGVFSQSCDNFRNHYADYRYYQHSPQFTGEN